MPKPKVSIIIVSWNVSQLLDICLSSLQYFPSKYQSEVIVVDSASVDESVSMVRQKHPEVKLIAADQNLGFTRGNNAGLKIAKGDYILYLNPDVELIEDAIGPMIDYLESHPEVGIVGCKLLNTDRSHQNSIGTFTRFNNLWREYVLREKAEKVSVQNPNLPTIVESVLGACLLVRGDVVRHLGGFDERYFMYQEEVDLCMSFQESGYATVYLPTVSMIHHGSKSSTYSAETRQRTLDQNRRSQYLFFQKHYGSLQAQCAKTIIIVSLTSKLLPLWIIGRLQPKKQVDTDLKRTYYRKTIGWLFNH